MPRFQNPGRLQRAGGTSADGAEPQVSAVLLDILMPVMDGEETFRQMRSLWAGVPVILISGFELGDTAKRFGEPLPDGYVQKPFSMAKLAGAVRSILN